MSDAEIIIGADASKLVRELRTAQDEFDRLTRAQQRAGGAAGALDGALAKAKTRLDAASSAAHKAGIGVETMDTAAACRTYNILVGEGRQVMAALLIGD